MASLNYPGRIGSDITVPDEVVEDYTSAGWVLSGSIADPVEAERTRPAQSASKAVWVAYAETDPAGAPDGLDDMSKADLIAHYTSEGDTDAAGENPA